ncbi:MAG TPA: hypothetical protein VKU19_03380 [Bryobacteraceae bacterium]|nr:hypothetical protein [Bryobacteraceae bacterium]
MRYAIALTLVWCAWAQREPVRPSEYFKSFLALGLEDFWEEQKPVPIDMKARVTLDWTLPRVGTTIEVRPLAICAGDAACDPVDAVIRQAKYRSISLAWNSQTGKFSKSGKKPR